MSTRCGPKSIYTKEQEQWLDRVREDLLQGLDKSNGRNWETKFKKESAKAFIEKFGLTLDVAVDWENVHLPISLWIKDLLMYYFS
jgi:hypothetical protein